MSAIRFDDVWKEYGDHIVLERISLDIESRAFIALVGPSGCGKTTLLRMLLGDDYGFAMMPHGDYASEMEVYVKHGVPPIEILRWATSNGADALRERGRELGRIAKGKLADLVVVAGDPTQDVSLFRNPDNVPLVVKDGLVEKDLLTHTVVAA